MDVQESASGSATLLRAAGRVDSASSAAFEAALLPRIRAGAIRVVLDLSGVEYVSSAGLRVMLMAAKAAKAGGGQLALCCLSPMVAEVFRVSGFSKIIPILGTETEALSAVGA